ncbi:MAG: hypothetical protein H6826_14435 [Planctomycetes bacterium]|nr:hypothetical protein [Planctomycetota bacterium]
MTTTTRTIPGWSAAQIKLAGMAAGAAGWNDGQRYLALRYAGCPVYAKTDRPSARHPRNSQDSFEAYMALAEERALELGVAFPRPRRGTWYEASRKAASRLHRKISQVAGELEDRVPDKFHRGFLIGFLRRMTAGDPKTLRSSIAGEIQCVEDLDAGQSYRVLEGLKAWGGRELSARGLTPTSFRCAGQRRGAA